MSGILSAQKLSVAVNAGLYGTCSAGFRGADARQAMRGASWVRGFRVGV